MRKVFKFVQRRINLQGGEVVGGESGMRNENYETTWQNEREKLKTMQQRRAAAGNKVANL